MTIRSPALGEFLYLDGLWYMIGAPDKRPDSSGQFHDTRHFHRPDRFREMEERKVRVAAKAAGSVIPSEGPHIEPNYKANFNYKLEGECFPEDLVYLEAKDIAAAIEQQADDLMGGSKRRRSWAAAARDVQRQEFLDRKEGAWTLPGRLLLKPTCVKLRLVKPAVEADPEKGIEAQPERKFETEVAVVPTDKAICRELCLAIQRSDDVFPLIEKAGLDSLEMPAEARQLSPSLLRW